MLTNLQDGKFDFDSLYDRKFETFQTLGNERPDDSIILMTVRNRCIRLELKAAVSVRTSVQQYRQGSGMARRQFATVLKTYRASRSLSCEKGLAV